MRQSDKRTWLLLAAILLLALGLRMINLGGRTLWYDEAFTVLFAEKGWDAMLDGTLDADEDAAAEEHPLLYYQLLHYWMEVFGQSPVAVRLFSALLGVATVALVFGLARAWFDDRTALSAALITSVAPFHVQYSQETRMYALLALVLVSTTWAFTRAWQRGHWAYWVTFGVLSATSMYVQQLAAFYLLALGLLPFVIRDRARAYRTLAAGSLAVVIYLPWLVHLPDQMQKLRNFWVQEPTVLHFWLVLRSFISVNLDFAAAWWVPTFLLAAILPFFLFFRAYPVLRGRDRKLVDDRQALGWALWLAFMPMVLMWIASYLFQPLFLPRALLPSAVVFYMAVAWLFVRSRVPVPIVGVLAVAWSVVIVFGLVTLYTWDIFPTPPFDDALDYLEQYANPDDGDAIVHGNKITALPMVYYDHVNDDIDLPQHYVRDIPDSGSDTLARSTQEVLGLLAEKDIAIAVGDAPRVWYITFKQLEDEMVELVEDDPDNAQYDSLTWLRDHYHTEQVKRFEDLNVYLFTDRVEPVDASTVDE
ncbi:MAG: hypothetical protein GYB65_00890 [Chloroflexi bacterium]|nr:hypothetical protein [Chloroflexota bacterium]